MYRERVQALMEANRDDSEMLDFVEERVNSFRDYVGYVNFMETRIQRLNVEGLTGQEWRDAVQSLDEHRRMKHEVAISAVNQLNRLSISCGLEPFYDGPVDDEHRNEIGDLCQDVMNEYFKGRHMNPLTVSDLMDGKALADAVDDLSEGDGEVL